MAWVARGIAWGGAEAARWKRNMVVADFGVGWSKAGLVGKQTAGAFSRIFCPARDELLCIECDCGCCFAIVCVCLAYCVQWVACLSCVIHSQIHQPRTFTQPSLSFIPCKSVHTTLACISRLSPAHRLVTATHPPIHGPWDLFLSTTQMPWRAAHSPATNGLA